tara:strand:+ start:516 stop:728 length:213 start_codon:yes stop_codon:yes gene_type:complete
MNPGDLVRINGQTKSNYNGLLAIIQEKRLDIVLPTDKIPPMWQIWCFKAGKQLIFFEDELMLISKNQKNA